MKILSIDPALASALHIPFECVCDLQCALERLFSDGDSALSGNPGATQNMQAALKKCGSCATHSSLQTSMVVSGDDWECNVHSDSVDNSIDVIIATEDDASVVFLPIEGKLGLAFEYPGDRAGKSVTLSELERKYLGARKLLPQSVKMSPKLLLLVPMDGQEWMWYLIRKWNAAGNKIGKVFSCCVADFLTLMGLPAAPHGGSCATNSFRTELLRQEFESVGPMSCVQLPPPQSCLACGKCRDACADRVGRHAISMVQSDAVTGALRPFIDTLSCKGGCRECERVCPVLHPARELKK